MADILDDQSFGNFSIENTMEQGLGNAQLLQDLLSSETATAEPDEIEKIVQEIPKDKIVPEEKVPKGKVIIPKAEGEENTAQDLLKNFLADSTSEDDDEEIIEEEGKVKEVVKEKEEEEESEASPFTALSRDLLKLGVFTKDEEEEEAPITTPEEFLDRFRAESKKGAIEVVNNFIGRFGQDYQDAFDAIFVKGASPKDYFEVYNKVVSFAELDMSQEDNQVKVIRQALTDQGLEPEDVTTEIDRLKNYGDLETVSAKHHKVLVKRQAVKLQEVEQRAEQELQQKSNIKTQYIQNVQQIIQDKLKTKEFDGIPINPKLAGELQDFLLTDKFKTASGETLTDFDRTILELKRPENHAQKVKVALILKMLEKDPTLSTIQRSGVTKKSDQLFEEVARQVTREKKPVSSTKEPKSWFS